MYVPKLECASAIFAANGASPRIAWLTTRVKWITRLAIFAGEEPREAVPSEPPLIVIEILSPDDRMSETLNKLSEYRAWGVRHVWLVDPETRGLYTYAGSGLSGTDAFQLAEYGVRIAVDDVC